MAVEQEFIPMHISGSPETAHEIWERKPVYRHISMSSRNTIIGIRDLGEDKNIEKFRSILNPMGLLEILMSKPENVDNATQILCLDVDSVVYRAGRFSSG